MNYPLKNIPERQKKDRKVGLTMVMDKGLSKMQAESLIETGSDYIDFLKLGFGTGLVSQNVKTKIDLYKKHNLIPYFGGTLFEVFYVRNQMDDFKKYISKHKVELVEVSDGSIKIEHDQKCEVIRDLKKDFQVISEVGSKEEGYFISPKKWISMMNAEIEAGSEMVIAEARESGNVGIFRPNKTAHVQLINKIISKVPEEKILWEAPQKNQQVWFIKHFGTNVSLGNIAPNEVLGLECLRLGLRGDTFFNFLNP